MQVLNVVWVISQISHTQSLRKCDTLLLRVQSVIIIIFIAAPAIYYWKIMVSEIQATGGKKSDSTGIS